MKLKNNIILGYLALSSCLIFGQKLKIKAFENNLTQPRDLIFEDSLVAKYSIYERMKYYKIPSVSMALIENGKMAWVKSYGFTDAESKIKTDENTMYQVASISKSVNALGITKLVQQGELSFETDIRKYLKTWRFPENEFSKNKLITLKNLLSHTAGFNVRGFIGYSYKDKIPTINQILDGDFPANNEAIKPILSPGEKFEYSGGGSTIVRKILDDCISNNYDSLMQAILLNPLQMTKSTFNQNLLSNTKFAFGHDQNMKPLKGKYYSYPEQAAGGLWSTARDIAKFIIHIQNSLLGSKGSILTKESTNEMLTPVLNDYALGFGILEKDGEKYFWHEGQSFGYTSVYYGSFSTGKGVVILTNAFPDNGQPFIKELLNSIAITYNWNGFYNPIKKKLAILPKSSLNQYVGEYFSEDPPMKITITQNGNDLELTARRPEKLFYTGQNNFFLSSSPNDSCIFSSSNNNGKIDTFEVIKDGKTLFKTIKK